jgi:uncharacterized protein (DUF1697 family)
MRSTTWIALLRGINLTGHRTVRMAELRALFEELGYEEPRTLLQSGNVVFRSRVSDAGKLARRLETETEKRLGVRTRYVLRSAAEWEAIVAANPFPEAARTLPARYLVMALTAAPEAAAVEALRRANPGKEKMKAIGRELFVVYPDGVGVSKLNAYLVDRHLGCVSTARNWNTVLKLAALSAEGAA